MNISKEERKRRMSIPRHKMPEQDPIERGHNFQEVNNGYPPEIAQAEAQRCIQCPKPQCVAGCPVHVKIPEFIACIALGKFVESNPFVEIDFNNFASAKAIICAATMIHVSNINTRAEILLNIGMPQNLVNIINTVDTAELERLAADLSVTGATVTENNFNDIVGVALLDVAVRTGNIDMLGRLNASPSVVKAVSLMGQNARNLLAQDIISL